MEPRRDPGASDDYGFIVKVTGLEGEDRLLVTMFQPGTECVPLAERDARREGVRDLKALRLLGAVAWLGATQTFGILLFLVGGFGSSRLFGEDPSAQGLRSAAWYTLAAGTVMSLGPLVIWFRTRGRWWLGAAVLIVVVAISLAAKHGLDSLSA